MTLEDQPDSRGEQAKTARTVGQLVKYSRALNNSDTVREVAILSLEAAFHVVDGRPHPTVMETRGGELCILDSMAPGREAGERPGPIPRHASETGTTTLVHSGGTEVAYAADDTDVLEPLDIGIEPPESDVTLAAPRSLSRGPAESGIVVMVEWDSIDRLEEPHVKPVEYLADYVATAIGSVRTRQRLERTQRDLERRTELLELYDSLLRHDLRNDLQVIRSFAGELDEEVDSPDLVSAVENIDETADHAMHLIERVGKLVETIADADDVTPRPLEPILTAAIDDATTKYESLSVTYDPSSFEYDVYAGKLLDSVFSNVLTNAAVHNDGPVEVTISAEVSGPESLVLTFADDGSGLPEGVRSDLFDIGESGDGSEGSGFGLGLSRALVETYGGDIDVSESDQGGAAFRVRLSRC